MTQQSEEMVNRLLNALAELASDLNDMSRRLKDEGRATNVQVGVDVRLYENEKLIVECFADVLEGGDLVAWWMDLERTMDSGWIIDRRLLGHDASGEEIVLERLPKVRLVSSEDLADRLESLTKEMLKLTPSRD